MLIYCAGPLTQGDRRSNCERAARIGHEIRLLGHQPYVSHLWDLTGVVDTNDLSYEQWMSEDFKWLAVCEALFRIPGFSPGAEREVTEANRLRIPVYTSLCQLQHLRH